MSCTLPELTKTDIGIPLMSVTIEILVHFLFLKNSVYLFIFSIT